jgi:hypothetical protein
MGHHKITVNDKQVLADDIPFKIVNDASMVLELEDGAKLRLRTIVLNVMKTDERDENGNYIYVVQNGTVIVVDQPPKEGTQ